MSGVNIPTDSTHLSDQARADMIEQYGGTVDSQFAKKSIMRNFVNVKSVRGTDTLINRRIGRTVLTTITPGVRPAASKTEFGKRSITVDTVIMARDNRSLLNEFQIDFNARQELGKDHGKELAKKFDETMLIAGLKGSLAAAPTDFNHNGAFGDGHNIVAGAAGDELDPLELYTDIAAVITSMEEDDIDTEETVIFVRPTQYDVLLNNDKLIDRDFSTANGDFADGKFSTIKGVPVVQTTRLPIAPIVNHELSNDDNNFAYDVNANEAGIRALVMHPKAVLAGETIPMTSDVFYSDIEKQWFIDSFMSYGATFNRADACGGVFINGTGA